LLNRPNGTLPLTAAEFGAALEGLALFEAKPFLAVAVSGGPDSLALAILADRWARRRGGEICALTVDHRLRPESTEEVRRLRAWLAARHIRHEILVWLDEKPAAGIEAAAREARYRLLARWCREHGCLHLLTAHHREDQIETYLMRRRAGSGPHGLAGMSAIRELADCRLMRPLLGITRTRLAALLAAEGQPFITDPSNLDPVFERARLRIAGGGAACEPPRSASAERIADLAAARQAGERACGVLLARMVMLHPAGFAALDAPFLRSAAPALAERALAAVTQAIGGASYPPRTDRIVRLRLSLAGDAAGRVPRGRTLGGCRFVSWREHILVLREAAAAAGPIEMLPGTERVWDRRFRVALSAAAPQPVQVGYLGPDGVVALGGRRPALRRFGLPRLVYPLLPAVWDRAGLAAVPALDYRRDRRAWLPRVVLNPVNCLAAAPFAVVWPAALLMSSQDEDGRGPLPIGVG
jgi:tRNA(Ile)-lysidine synthase